MLAVQLSEDLEPTLREIPIPQPEDDECLIRVQAAALNRRDYWIKMGKYPGIIPGVTLGSDGCGIVEQGPQEWMGKEVVINPNVNWGDNPEYQSQQYSILGMPTNGTLAQYITVPVHRLQVKPKHLNPEQAAAMLLAGMTAYRACFTKSMITTRNTVLITGIGGGVAQMALAFAISAQCNVLVTSGSGEKIERAVDHGATAGYNYRKDEYLRELQREHGKVDVIIDSAGGEDINNFLRIVRPSGKIVLYGATNGRARNLIFSDCFGRRYQCWDRPWPMTMNLWKW